VSEDRKMMIVGSADTFLKVYKVDSGTVKLLWATYNYGLTMRGIKIEGVVGLSHGNLELIKSKQVELEEVEEEIEEANENEEDKES
jgi:hypothetical protein